jgi:Ca-activated chloride channel family protein
MTFTWPLALLGLVLLPALLALYVWMQSRRQKYAVRFTNLELLRQVAGPGPGIRRHIPPALFLLGLAALLVSLARPSLVLAVPRSDASIMLVLDVSGSMAASDLQPSRMTAATRAAHGLIEKLPDSAQVGVVSFNQSSSVVAPLSSDASAADRALGRLRADGGTAIGEGLSAALDQLAQRPTDSQGQRAPAVVVLLSDGESNGGRPPATVAERARQEGVTVETVGIGQRGTTATVNLGQQRVGLDETTLQNIATTTGGHYFYAADENQLQQVFGGLGSGVSWVEERTEVTALVSGLGAVFFVVGGLFALRWFGRLP